LTGRPREYDREKLLADLLRYIDESDVPILAEFAYQNDVPRQTLQQMEELSSAIKKLIDKKQANLERGALGGQLNTTMAIFSLKQMGWKDNPEEGQNKIQVELVGGFSVAPPRPDSP
jgi:hypothetical protein